MGNARFIGITGAAFLATVLATAGNARGGAVEVQKLLASDGELDDRFGHAVWIDGNVAVVGAPGPFGGKQIPGATYVFRRDGESGAWVEEQKLTADDGEAADRFGYSVAVAGNFAFVGAYGDSDNGAEAGAVYVFKRDPTHWVQFDKIVPFEVETKDRYGLAVAARGDLAIVGAPSSLHPHGRVFIYRWNGLAWVEDDRFLVSADDFGAAVAIGGDAAIVGAPGDDFNAGKVFFLRYDGDGPFWFIEQDVLGATKSQLGASVAISGDVALAGAPAQVCCTPPPQSAIVYQWNPEVLQWSESQTLFGESEHTSVFGRSVAIESDAAIVGEPRQLQLAHVFRGSPAWDPEVVLSASDEHDGGIFGYAVSLSGDLALVGRPEPGPIGGTGAAFVFDLSANPCSTDLDGNGVVDILDLLRVLTGWGGPGGDANGDGTTNVLDLLAVLSTWGPCDQR